MVLCRVISPWTPFLRKPAEGKRHRGLGLLLQRPGRQEATIRSASNPSGELLTHSRHTQPPWCRQKGSQHPRLQTPETCMSVRTTNVPGMLGKMEITFKTFSILGRRGDSVGLAFDS